jgi:predicted nucleic acid-binding protein
MRCTKWSMRSPRRTSTQFPGSFICSRLVPQPQEKPLEQVRVSPFLMLPLADWKRRLATSVPMTSRRVRSSERSGSYATATSMFDCVVDTDGVSYGMLRDSRADRYARHLNDKLLAISFMTAMTVAELGFWPLRRGWGAERRRQDDALCDAWAQIVASGVRAGAPVPPSDAWIAAAWLYQVLLVTNNTRHFASIPGLQVITVPE